MKRFVWLLMLTLLLPVLAMGEGDMILMDEFGAEVDEEALSDVLEEAVEMRTIAPVYTARPTATPMPEGTYETLQVTDEGDGVKNLQQQLFNLGYYDGEITGHFGERTKQALISFQHDWSMTEDGIATVYAQRVLFGVNYRPLDYGAQGRAVEDMQKRLSELGYYTGTISGNYLDSTETAIKAFQQKMGLDVNGIADITTLSWLFDSRARSIEMEAVQNAEADNAAIDEIPYTKQLKYGSTGELVKKVQQRLIDLCYYAGNVSGNFQGNTRNAVKAFQKQNGLEVDGVVAKATWDMLFNSTAVVPPDATAAPSPVPDRAPYYIVVDVNNQVTTVYGQDGKGDYTVVVREMICSTGTKAYPSDLGDWTTNGKRARWSYFPKWGGYAQYWTRINANIAFHSVCYNTVDTMGLSKKSYNALGSRASHGCVRLLVSDAKWVYDHVGKGTVVHVTEDLPADPELVDSVKAPKLDTSRMAPVTTPQPTAEPVYVSNGLPPEPTKSLSRGSQSENVWWLQMKLKELGYYNGKCSGHYLDGTVKAVKAYQKANGLQVTGNADKETLKKLWSENMAAAESVTATPAPVQTLAPTAK